MRWYAYDNWIVTVKGNQVVVVQGQKGGVLWFHPKVVDRTGKTIAQVDPSAWQALQAGVAFPSLQEARVYVGQIEPPPTTTTTSSTTATTVPPQSKIGGVAPSISTTTSPSTTTSTTVTGAP